jgi:hypothetical protein
LENIQFASGAGSGVAAGSVAGTRPLSRTWITPRSVRVTLGLFWLIDGGLQFQPYMFSHNFIAQTIGAMAAGQPAPIQWTINTAVQIASPYRVEFNALFALVQVAIGVGLIAGRRWLKPALLLSFAWAFIVWWFGEGVGMIPMGMASPLTGAPGAVLLYALVGVIVWPTAKTADISVASGGLLGDYYARVAWGILWLLLAVLTLQPVNRAANGFSSTFSTAASSSPGPFANLNSSLASVFAGRGAVSAVVLAVILAAIGIAVFLDWYRNAFLVAGSVFALLIWITAEYFGGMFTGQGTDPNSGPMILLLAATLFTYKTRVPTGPASG